MTVGFLKNHRMRWLQKFRPRAIPCEIQMLKIATEVVGQAILFSQRLVEQADLNYC